MSKRLNDLTKILKKQNEYINFRSINQEVKIIDKSKELPDFPVEIMLDNNNKQEYTLFDGSHDHFIVVDLGDIYFLKSIQIGLSAHDCCLKNFNVQTKNREGYWEDVGKFICAKYNSNQGLQEFNIGKETQFVRIDLLDTWGVKSGNYILIKKIFFAVADIV